MCCRRYFEYEYERERCERERTYYFNINHTYGESFDNAGQTSAQTAQDRTNSDTLNNEENRDDRLNIVELPYDFFDDDCCCRRRRCRCDNRCGCF